MKLPWDKHDDKDARRNGAPPDASGASDDHDLTTVSVGDAISFWGEGDKVITCIYDCAEDLGERGYHWRWIFLDDDSLVEQSGDGQWRYADHQVAPQGSALFSDLVGPGGLLEQFEARVRNDTVGDDPVFVSLKDRRYRVTSSGTVVAKQHGTPPAKLAPWGQFVEDYRNNIYFSLVAADDEEQGVLGLWTSHVCLSFGKPIGETDIDGVYRK